jgi:glycogen(starch) synthase
MRALYWTQLFRPYVGGVEVLARHFLPAMRSRGYELAVVTSHGSLSLPDEDVDDGVPVYRFPFQTALASRNAQQVLNALHAVARLKRRFKPDLVHINLSDPSVFFHLHSARAHPAPSLVVLSVALPQRAAAAADTLLGNVLGSASWVVTNSAAMLAEARALLPAITPRSSVIYNAVVAPDDVPTPLPFDAPRVLCLGRIVDDKGFDIAVTAFADLASRFANARLLIAGDGPARPLLEQQAARLGIASRVDFIGWVPPERVPALINTATVVVMPSRWREAFGLVALQAAQMGRPVIATRVGGLPEVVVHQQTGLLVEKDDSRGLADALAFLLGHPTAAEAMGRAGRERALAVFSWPRHLDAYDALYRDLCRGYTLGEEPNADLGQPLGS